MKFQKNEKYASIALYACIAVIVSALVILGILNFSKLGSYIKSVLSALSPIVYGFVIAYLANHIMVFIEKKVFHFKNSKRDLHVLRRTLSIVLTFLLMAGVIAVIVVAVVPQVTDSISDFGSHLNGYIANIQNFADKIVEKYSEDFLGTKYTTLAKLLAAYDMSFNIKELLSSSFSVASGAFNYVFDYGGIIVSSVIDIILGIILAVYFLACKEKISAQAKKLCCAILPHRHYLNTVRLARYTHKTFGGFIVGKIIDAVVVGLLTFVVLMIFDVPYYPLLAVIVGVPNVIPTFGPIFGGVCGGILLLIVDPGKLLLYIIVILIIQQLDGNFIEPMILGDSLGISAMWVIIAIVTCGAFFGFGGLVVGVPAFSVLYVLIKQWSEKRLKAKGYPYHTEYYKNTPSPEYDKIQPEYVLIESNTEIPEPTFDDDIIIIEKEKISFIKRIANLFKKKKGIKKK